MQETKLKTRTVIALYMYIVTVLHIVTICWQKEQADSLGFFLTIIAMILRTWESFNFYFRFSIILKILF